MFGFAGFGELLERVRPCRFKQAPPAGRSGCIECDEGLRDEAGDGLRESRRRSSRAASNGGRRLDREPGSEDGQGTQHPPFCLREELITPVERSAERLVAR
jgi:hypothetical protein